ncbi:MAG: DUF6924 domain-containing protein, partial [Actinocrinis sp.]
ILEHAMSDKTGPQPTGTAGQPCGPAEPPRTIEGYEDISPLVIRTDFTDEDVWARVVEELRTPLEDDDPVQPYLICDPRYADAATERIVQDVRAALAGPDLPDAVFIADSTTMRETDHPLLAVSTEAQGQDGDVEDCDVEDCEEYATQFRVLPHAAAVVSVNLGIGNMDFEDYASDGHFVYGRE